MKCKALLLINLLVGVGFADQAFADRTGADKSGDFDYYVLALSWNEGWCKIEGNEKHAPQCERELGFTLHGLWPQYVDGWPQFCQSLEQNPSRSETAAMADLYGSAGSAWHQWRKHGTCSGMSSEDYFQTSRELFFERFKQPQVLLDINEPVAMSVPEIELAIIESNMDLSRDSITVNCEDGVLTEIKICYDRGMRPQDCLSSAAEECPISPLIIPISEE